MGMPKHSNVLHIQMNHLGIQALRLHLEMFQQTFSNALTSSSPRSVQPPHIITQLKDHQLAAIGEMRTKELAFQTGYTIPNTKEIVFSKYAILGDRAGVGKTQMILGHISQMATLPLTQVQNSYSNLSPMSTSSFFTICPGIPTEHVFDSLIVVPHTLYTQWQDIIIHTTKLKVHFIKSKRDLGKNLVESLSSSHMTLITNTLLPDFMKSLTVKNPRWRRIFYDEPDTLHIKPSCPVPQANMTWFVSSSYINMLLTNYYVHSNSIRQLPTRFVDSLAPEIKEMLQRYTEGHPNVTFFKVVSYAFFKDIIESKHPLRGHLVIRSTDAFLNASIQLPPLIETTVLCRTPRQQLIVERAIPPEVESMLHAGDIHSAIESLGIPLHTPLTLVEAVTEFRKKEIETLKKQETSLELQQKLHHLEVQLQGIKERLEQTSKDVCAICYDSPNSALITPCCSKQFCASCILTWFLKTPACPLCRTGIHPNELKALGETTVLPSVLPKKTEALLKILKNAPLGKFLVFSRFDNPLVYLERSLNSCQTLQGNKDTIAKQLLDFKEGRISVLLLNSRISSAGLDLLCASHVILLHRIPSEEEKQILGRAYRLGRTEPLEFIKLFHTSE